jgi:hypothetical protein
MIGPDNENSVNNFNVLRLSKLLRMMRLFKMLKGSRISQVSKQKLQKKIKRFSDNQKIIVGLVPSYIIWIMVAYVISCLWYYFTDIL